MEKAMEKLENNITNKEQQNSALKMLHAKILENKKNQNYEFILTFLINCALKIINTNDKSFIYETALSYAKYFSYVLPSLDNIKNIKEFLEQNKCPQILEIGSGMGLWATLLRRKEMQIIATDIEVKDTYTEVKQINCGDAIEKYKSCCLFLCWPDKETIDSESLKKFKGNFIIYIGKSKGLETGNDGFFEELDNNWKLQKQEDVPVDWNLAPGKTCIYYYIRDYGGAEESKSDGKKIKRRSKKISKRRSKKSNNH